MIAFALAVFFLIITPGPGVLSTAGVGSAFGFRAGFAYVTGLWAGNNLVSFIVITGLATLLLASDIIRTILMLLSTAYLFYLAARIIFAGAEVGFMRAKSQPGLASGVFLQLVNPKAYAVNTALFTSFAFLPANITAEIIIKIVIFNLIWILILNLEKQMIDSDNDVTITRAVSADSADLSKVAQKAYDIYLDRMDKKPAPMLADFHQHISEDIVFIAKDRKGRIAGYVVLQQIDQQWWLDNIATHPDYQGQGIGTRLRIEAEQYCALLTDTLQLYTNIVMVENVRWYERAGYVMTKQALVNGYERFYFKKRLR